MSPLDDLSITIGPTAVVKHCVDLCECVCVYTHLSSVSLEDRLEARLQFVVFYNLQISTCCTHNDKEGFFLAFWTR